MTDTAYSRAIESLMEEIRTRDEKLAAIVAKCQKYNHSGVNLETHRLADAVIKIAKKESA